MRKLIIAFWICIGCILLWQFYTYDQGLDRAGPAASQQHFYFFHTNGPASALAKAHHDGADVEQTDFSVDDNTPATGSYTCRVTLKNVGNAQAIGVQVKVRPYRGISNYDEDTGHQNLVAPNDDDPISVFGDYVAFPDLAPGESSTQSVVFLSRPEYKPGKNPNPEILFQSAKASPPPVPAKRPPRGEDD